AQEEFFSVQEKRSVLLKFKMPQSETLRADLLSILAAEREAALIKRGRGRRPELWVSNGEFRKLPHALPGLQVQALGMHGRAIGSRNRDRQVQRRRQFLRVVQPRQHRALRGLSRRDIALDVHQLKRNGRNIHQMKM